MAEVGSAADDSGRIGSWGEIAVFVETSQVRRMKAPADSSTTESTTNRGSHRKMIVRSTWNTELGLDLIGLVGTAHLSTQSGCPKVERVRDGTGGRRGIETKASAPLTSLRL